MKVTDDEIDAAIVAYNGNVLEIVGRKQRNGMERALEAAYRVRKARKKNKQVEPSDFGAVKDTVETRQGWTTVDVVAEYFHACRYAESLAKCLHAKHYQQDGIAWNPMSGDLVGLLTQIDNMAAGLDRTQDDTSAALRKQGSSTARAFSGVTTKNKPLKFEAGMKYQTRSGRLAKLLGKDSNRLYGKFEGGLHEVTWELDGRYSDCGAESPLDLVKFA